MKIFLALVFGVMGSQAYAQVSRSDCRYEFSWEEDRRECRQIIRSSRGSRLNRRALNLCMDHEISSWSKLSCMREVSHARFDRNAMDVCEFNMRFDMNKGDCVKAIADADYNRVATAVCASPRSDAQKIECLEVSKNKTYRNRVERYCGDLSRDRDIVSCMRERGTYMRNHPRRRGHRRGDRRSRRYETTTTYSTPAPATRTTTTYDRHSYEVCYEQPRQRVVEVVDRAQNRRGSRLVLGGIAGVIGGAIIGGDAGDVIAAAGVGVAAWGAIEIADSREIFYVDGGVDCRRYYTEDTRRRSFRRDGKQCTTKRYYSTDWTGSEEYFETTCVSRRGRSSTYVTFTRSSEIWY